MALDPETLLASVEAAIEALLTGGHSSYSIGPRSVTRLDLAQLFKERQMLMAEVERSTGRSIRVAKLVRPRR